MLSLRMFDISDALGLDFRTAWVMRWSQLRFDCDSTAVRLSIKCNWDHSDATRQRQTRRPIYLLRPQCSSR